MNPFTPPSPVDRLRALRRALWEEDRAAELALRLDYLPLVTQAEVNRWAEALMASAESTDRRMEAERDLWGCLPRHGLD